jgi:NAD(P)H-hydrate epimerase
VIPVLTSAETREIDRQSESRGVPVLDLMERAGWAVARAALSATGGGYGRRALVVAGKGNNGGDGLVAARHLAARGMGVTALLVAAPEELSGPAAENLRRLEGVRVAEATPERLAREALRADVVVDALFGTGFRGAPEGLAATAIEAMNGSGAAVVAADIPSGVDADTAAVRGEAVWADVTVTFGAPKVGLVLYPGAEHAGILEVADIGFPADLLRSDLVLVQAGDVRRMLPAREPDTHKRRTGVVAIVAGSRDMPGAASLVASGAASLGAGLIRLAVVPSVRAAAAVLHPEATFLPLPESADGIVAAGAWDALGPELDRVQAVAIGPGLTSGEEAAAEIRRIVLGSPVPVVADADALTAFAGRAAELAEREGELVITPHEGEFERLFGASRAALAEDRVGLVRKAAETAGCTVVLKGSRSLIAEPGGEVRVNPTGTSFLATGGTGDLLTGAVATLLARGLSGVDAATAAAYVHGLAGRRAGEDLGEGATSADVAARLAEAAASARETE